MFNTRSVEFLRGTSVCAFYILRHFYTPVYFFSEKPNHFSLDVNTRPRGKIQILATSAPRDGKLSFVHFCISFITSRRKNAYGIVSEIPECPEARRAAFSPPSNRAPIFSFRFFNLPSLSTRTLYNVRDVSFRAIT